MTDEYAEFRKHLPDGKPLGVLVDFSIPIAQRLSDLSGIDDDLKAVVKICERLERMDCKPSDAPADPDAFIDNMQLCDALFDAAVIRFGRVQTTGARKGMPTEWVTDLPKFMQINYRNILDLRNKFIAHPVAPLEDNQVYIAVYVEASGPVGVGDITVASGKVFRGSAKDARCLLQLVTALRARLASEIESEKASVLKAAQSMPLATILARGYSEFDLPSSRNLRQGRKKFPPS